MQGSHFSGQTKFHDISMIFPGFFSKFPGIFSLLLPANEVWDKVIFSEACVKNSVHRGGACSWGVWSGLGGGLGPGGLPGGQDGHCCRQYASYWNAFLFLKYNFQAVLNMNMHTS